MLSDYRKIEFSGCCYHCNLDYLSVGDLHAVPYMFGPIAEQESERQLPRAHQ
jgi:hypothetical protein